MRPAEVLLLVLVCGSQTIGATEKNKSSSRKLNGKQEAIALVKRQEFGEEPFCEEGYYRCSPVWGGGCCMIGRQCASPDCPALGWRPSVIPNAINPTPTYPDAPDRFFDEPIPSDFMPLPSDPDDDEPEDSPTPTELSEPTSTEEAESTQRRRTTRSAAARTTPTSSREATETADRTVDSEAMRTGSSTATLVPAAPPGIMTKGAVVGIAFAGITGAVILGFAIWRMILGKKLPKRKPGGGSGGGGGGGGGGGSSSKKPLPVMVFGTKPSLATRLNPWAKKPNWIEEQQRQETSERNGRESAMGLTGAVAPTGLYDAPPQRGIRGEPLTPGPITPGLGSAGLAPAPHERTGLMDDDDEDDRRAKNYERSYRSVESFDDDDEMDQRGLFGGVGSPRGVGGGGGGGGGGSGTGSAAPASPNAPVAPTSPNAPPASWPVPQGMPSSQYRPTSYGYGGTGGARDGPGFPEK